MGRFEPDLSELDKYHVFDFKKSLETKIILARLSKRRLVLLKMSNYD